MRILGISAFYHDSAAALIEDGRIVAAAQEERFTRKKHDAAFPVEAIRYCLDKADTDLDGVNHVVFFEKPLVKFERLVETYLGNVPSGFQSFRMAMPLWIKDKLFQKSGLLKSLKPFSATGEMDGKKLLFAAHHQSHAASAFFPSPFDEAVVLAMDGVGEWTTTSVSIGRGNTLELKREIKFPHSLGLLYSAFTYYTGFKVNSGEYKVMGLAPYGEPKYYDLIMKHIVDVKPDGSFWLDLSYFNYMTGLTMTSEKFHELFGAPPRESENLVTQREMDLAASIQKVTEEIMLRMTRELARTYGIRNLCMAGGVALNCVANGRILRDGHFDRIWIQPAAGDAGGALGAALAAHYLHLGNRRHVNGALDSMQGSYLGPEFEQGDIEGRLTASGARYEVLDEAALLGRTVDSLALGRCGRLVPGPDGVRPARAWRQVHPWRSAQSRNAEDAEPQDQISRELPPLRPGGAARGRGRLFRARRG